MKVLDTKQQASTKHDFADNDILNMNLNEIFNFYYYQ